ncbi:hypothetical protein BJ912DRAFT_1040521 [Pholiota molesta]|nr:hypothetical protein BJ912DRAFT_1040521 [Pholiota molesta]
MFRFASRLYHPGPHGPHPHWVYGRRPSRLLWFLLGAGTTAVAMKSQAMAQYHGHGRHGWGSCRRVGVEGMGANPASASAPPASASAPSAAAQRGPCPLKAYEGWEKQQDERIAAEKAHMAKVSRQAVDTMVELTEATLESVLTTAEALKAKLAEHRVEREKQQKLLEEQVAAQRREAEDPPRLV